MGSLISKVLDSLSALGGKAEKRILYVRVVSSVDR